jgi:hypothetical protein
MAGNEFIELQRVDALAFRTPHKQAERSLRCFDQLTTAALTFSYIANFSVTDI